MIPQIKFSKEIKEFVLATLCFIPFALSINLLSWQYKLVSGGFPGYALVTNYLTGVSVGTFLIILNTIVLLANFLFVGKTSGIKGVYGYVAVSFLIDYTKPFFNLSQHVHSSLLFNIGAMSLQGLIAGSVIGVIIYFGYSFGSYSSLIFLVNKFWKIAPPPFFFLMDTILSVITIYFFGVERGVLLLINAVIFFFAFKYTLQLLNSSKIQFS
jgi:uncharacterized membrane-anchored protein YitT (DUF2179 family)